MRKTTLIYCGENGEASKALAETIRGDGGRVFLVNALMDIEVIDCDHVIVMPDVPGWRRDAIAKAYPGKMQGDPGILSTETIQTEFERRETVSALPEPKRRGRPPGSKSAA